MIVLLKLLKKSDNFVVYSYGYDEDNLDGEIKVSLTNPDNYEITKESKDERIGKKGTLVAIGKITKAVRNNDIKEILSYQS